MNWTKFNALLARYRLPPPRVVHSIYRPSEPMPPKSRMW
jgi:hypothetical protein